MPTSNIAITSTWTKIAATTDADLLVTFNTPVTIDVATTAADAAPTVLGHRLTQDSAITRGVLGTGHVWARLVAGSRPAEIVLVVSK